MPSDPSRDLGHDLKAAGIPKEGPGGKVDFHALRTAYINFVLDSGVSVREAQALARHSTPEMTMNVYGRTRDERLSDAVEKVASAVLPEVERAIYVQRQAVGAETENATTLEDKQLRSNLHGGAEGNRTPDLLNAIQALSQLSYSPNRELNNNP